MGQQHVRFIVNHYIVYSEVCACRGVTYYLGLYVIILTGTGLKSIICEDKLIHLVVYYDNYSIGELI